MKTVNKFLMVIVVVAITSLVVACATPTPTPVPTKPPAPTTAPAPTQPPAPTTAPAPTKPPAPTVAPTVSLSGCPSPDKPTTIALLGNKFPVMEHYAAGLQACSKGNLKVNVDWLSGADKTAKESAAMSTGKSPYDIIQTFDGPFVEYASKGWLYDLTPLVNKYKAEYKLDDIPQELWAANSYEGKIYGFPLIQNMQILFYRKDIFDDLKLTPPSTFDELVEVSKKIQDSKKVPYAYAAVWKKGADLSAEFANWLHAYNGDWFDKDGKPIFNSDKGVAAVKKMQEMLKYMPPNALNMNTDDVMIAFQQEQVAMINIWITRAARINDPKESKVVGKVAYAPAPSATKGGIPAGLWARDMYVIPKNLGNDPELVFRVILEATKPDYMKQGATLAMVSRTSVANAPDVVAQNPYTAAVLQAIKQGARSFPQVPYIGIARSHTGNLVADALAGQMKVEDALNQAAKDTERELKEKGFLK